MEDSKVLRENMSDVNRLLVKVSGIGITILYGLSFALYFYGYLDMRFSDLCVAAGSSYLIYLLTLLLYRITRLRNHFHYIFPFVLYLTVAVGIYFFQAPISAYPIWLIPIIYAGMYAHRGAMLLTALLVLVTGPIEVLYAGQAERAALIKDVAIASIVMLILSLRMISLVNRSRAIIAKTEQEAEKNLRLQRENEHLMKEVAAAAEEIGAVVEQLTAMAQGTRDAMAQISQGGEEMIAGSHDSKRVLLENQQAVELQAANSRQIGAATRQTVEHAELVRGHANSGETVVHEIAAVIKQIDEQSQDTANKVRQLTERTAEITAMNESIAAIAKNVTIVAINASIEAARAGAAGRTFQVVAEQVQNLAQQTAQAAQAIGELAERVQSDLASINHNLAENSAVVGRGVEISQDAINKLQLIRQAVAEIHKLLQSVDRDAESQQALALKISGGIAQLREKTERNVTHIETAAASTEETAAIMEEHVRIVQRLRERAETLQALIAQSTHRLIE